MYPFLKPPNLRFSVPLIHVAMGGHSFLNGYIKFFTLWKDMKRWIVLAGILLGTALTARAQRVTVSGYMTDALTGETLIGAGVLLDDPAARIGVGAVTNAYGFYTLTFPAGEQTLRYSHVGCDEVTVRAVFQKDTVIHIALESALQLEASSVVAQKDAGISSSYIGSLEVPVEQIRSTPVLFGEADVLKAIQMLPGVQGGGEGMTGLYVRGGGGDENLILLDGAPIYNVDHMFGLFSIFAPEAVKKVTLYKGSFPARYAGRVSSIVDIRTNDGNLKETHGSVSVGLISDKVHVEGPILRDRLSYSATVRGTHTVLYSPIIRLIGRKYGVYANYYFYDLNGKLTWRLSDTDRFSLGLYHGRDKTPLSQKETYRYEYELPGGGTDVRTETDQTGLDIHWGNSVAALRWNHVFGSRLFSNSTLTWNRYKMHMGLNYGYKGTDNGAPFGYRYDLAYNSGIRDIGVKTDFDYTPSPRHLVKFGAEYLLHTFIPERLTSALQSNGEGEEPVDTTFQFIDRSRYFGHEVSVYAEDDIALGKSVSLNVGAHFALFAVDGKVYPELEPRVSAKYRSPHGITVKAGYARMAQYVHQLTSSSISLPLDLWVPITADIRPVTSDQGSAGVYYDGLPGWEFSLEAYFKWMKNVLEYRDGTLMIFSSEGWEQKVSTGLGRAYGLEFMAKKSVGKWTGFLAYTLARSERRFPDGSISLGEWFPHKYDRRHCADLSLTWHITPRIDGTLTWSFASGNTTTIPLRQTVIYDDRYGNASEVLYTEHRNNYRLPPMHRMNLSFNFTRPHRKGESVWNVSIYNVYNSLNPNYVFLTEDYRFDPETGEGRRRFLIRKITILPILPTFSYTYQF